MDEACDGIFIEWIPLAKLNCVVKNFAFSAPCEIRNTNRFDRACSEAPRLRSGSLNTRYFCSTGQLFLMNVKSVARFRLVFV